MPEGRMLKKERKTLRLSEKIAVSKKCKYTCQDCGDVGIFLELHGQVLSSQKEAVNFDCTIYAAIPMEFDHIIPLNKGGKTELKNLQLLCRKCNRRKSDKNG